MRIYTSGSHSTLVFAAKKHTVFYLLHTRVRNMLFRIFSGNISNDSCREMTCYFPPSSNSIFHVTTFTSGDYGTVKVVHVFGESRFSRTTFEVIDPKDCSVIWMGKQLLFKLCLPRIQMLVHLHKSIVLGGNIIQRSLYSFGI